MHADSTIRLLNEGGRRDGPCVAIHIRPVRNIPLASCTSYSDVVRLSTRSEFFPATIDKTRRISIIVFISCALIRKQILISDMILLCFGHFYYGLRRSPGPLSLVMNCL